jgi:rhodanese-related sulfurtransferase
LIDAIQPAQIDAWIQQNQAAGHAQPVILDVREPWEVQRASVRPAGFTLITMPMASIAARLAELPRHQPIACLCHHGARSAQVAHFLKNQGFEHVFNISGGIHRWSDEVDSTVPRY